MAEVFVKEAPERATQTKTDDELVPLQLTIRPAYKDMWRPRRSGRSVPSAIRAIHSLPWSEASSLGISLRPRADLPRRGRDAASAGAKTRGRDRHRPARPARTQCGGQASHQLNVTASWLLGNGFAAIVHGEYQLNVGFGDVLVNLHLGLAGILPAPAHRLLRRGRPGIRVQRRRRRGVLKSPGTNRGILALLRAGGWRGIANRMRRAAQRHQASVLAGGGFSPSSRSSRCSPRWQALVSVYGLVANPEDVTRQLDAFAGALPPDIRTAIYDQMALLTARSTRSTLSLEAAIGIVAAIWAATKGMKALITGLSLAFGQKETRGSSS